MVIASTKPAASPSTHLNYTEIRATSEALAAPLEPEDCLVQTMPEVSPTKWHLAHVTWFFEKFCLCEYASDYQLFDERYHYLFNSYYYTVGEMHARPRRGLLNRPLLSEVLAYRAHVDAAMRRLMPSRADADLEFRVQLGLHHEQQHQELLLTDIKHVFFTNPLGPAYQEAADDPTYSADGAHSLPETENADPTDPSLAFTSYPGGKHEIGADPDAGFCFDNETPRHELLLDDYALSSRLVSNADYLEFIRDGGYRKPELWLADGWALVLSGELERPLYWTDDLTREFSLAGWKEILPASPVCHVSYYEADAFARWAGARLPTEAELELASRATAIEGNLLESGHLHPVPPPGRARAQGRDCTQLWGDVWEWTATPYMPYPRFRPLAGSLGEYNGKFMSNQMVVRGGSCVTSTSHLRPSYRSFFYPRDRWQFLGLRLAQDR